MEELFNNIKANYKKIDQTLVEKNIDKLDAEQWKLLSQYVQFTEDFLVKHKDQLDWKKVFKYQCFSIDFIEKKKYKGRINWKALLTNKMVGEELIEKYWLAKKMPWSFKHDQDWVIFSTRKFSQEFIRRHPEKISTFMLTQILWEEYITQNYWLIVACCNTESSSYGNPNRYEDWQEFRKKQKHLPDSFFLQFEYHSKEDAYKNLTNEIIHETGTDKIDWLDASCYMSVNQYHNSEHKNLFVDHIIEKRLLFVETAHTVATQLKADYKRKKTDREYLGEVNDFLHECFKEQLYEIALSLYETIRETAHLEPYIFHQSACLYLAANDFGNAILEIEKAMKYDYEYTDQLFTDRDLQPLFEDVKFKELERKWNEE